MLTAVLFLLVLSLVVLVHEAGHFLVAKKSGMKVYEFGWGFPPRAIGWYRDPKTKKIVWVGGGNKKNLAEVGGGTDTAEEFPATLYSINWLPLGGFVKIKGENGEDRSPDSFGSKSFFRRLSTIVAGVVMNVILAAVLLGVGFMIGLPTDMDGFNDPKAIVVEAPAVMIQQVVPNSAASQAGLILGEKIITFNGQVVKSADEVIALTKANGTNPIRLQIEGKVGQTREVQITPVLTDGNPRLGVMLANAGVVRYPWYIAIYKGALAAWFGLINIFIAFYLLIKNLILGNGLLFAVSGPVGVAVAVGESARLGFNYIINTTAMISLSLAAINILPIPALDGGRAFFIIIEKIIGRKVPAKYEQIIHAVGFVALLLLIVVITWRDIAALL